MLARSASSDAITSFDMILPSIIAVSHKQAVRSVAQDVAKIIGINERILSERLLEKETLNASTVSGSVMITPLKLSGLNSPLNILARFRNPVPVNTADNTYIDTLCLVLAPEREGNAYLPTMARLSRLLRQPEMMERLRLATDERSVRMALEHGAITLRAA